MRAFFRFFANRSSLGLGAAALLAVLLGFVAGFSLFFPAESLRPRLEQEAARRGLRLSIGALETAFPAGLRAQRVTLAASGKEAPALTIERLTLSPDWSSLVLGRLAVDFDARLLGGTAEGSFSRSGRFALRGSDLAWRGALPGSAGGTLVAHLRRGEIGGAWPARADEPLLLAIDCDQAAIEGLLGAKTPLNLGNIVLVGEGKGKDLRLSTIEASGGQLSVKGSGSLLLNQPLGRSPLNLALTLRAGAGLDPTLAELLTAFLPPDADGTSRLRLSGTLSSPQKSAGTE